MNSPGINCSVSLTPCDDILQIPPLNTDVIKSVNIVSMDSNDTDVSSKTTELKRSARLSKKRSLQDNSVIKITDRLDNSNEAGKQSKILRSNKTKSEIYVTPKNGYQKCNNRDSVMSTVNASSEPSNVSNVQPSLNIVVDNRKKMQVKSLPKTFKNKDSFKRPNVTRVKNESTVYNENTAEEDGLGSKHEKSDDLVKSTRKRGRPSLQKELQLFSRDGADKVNKSCENEVDRQKNGKGFPGPFENLLDIYESDSTTLNEADRTPTSESNNCDDGPSKPKRKRIGIDKSSTTNVVEIVGNDSCLSVDDGTEPIKVVATKTSEHDEVLPDADEPQPYETFDRQVTLVSNRFNVPPDTLRNIIEKESVPVFREKYSDVVTMSMVTVSPVVSMTDKGKRKWGWNSDGAASVQYKIEPIRESVAYEKTNLKDTMEEISKSMPSWSLSVVADPPRYVISHMSIETYGTPFADKAVVLDRHFRASVYIDQRLEYKYCKRYTTAPEIVNLIKQLDAIQ
ncbi:unnamed protein product [Macrosiphum euphorbiae]|uniref:Uncharacterized protein n=1 Tax=Macrosiphum euphorbiae TaxID=13131 RepID=A0AAV0W0Q4_9HEMI|nr:unnamed protein product [Macrosiphum euphorbiae]